MGDKAVDFASKAIDELNLKKRPRIDPAALLNPELIQRLKRQKAVVSVQPLVAISEFAVYDAIDHLGEEIEGIPPENIWNYDETETNITDDPGSKSIITKRGCK